MGRTIAAGEGEAVRTRTPRRRGGRGRAARSLGLAAHGPRQPTFQRAARSARLGGLRGDGNTPAAAAQWPSPAPRLASSGSAAELERGRRRGRFLSPSCCRRRADRRTRGAGSGAARRGRRDAAGLTGPDEAEREAASAGGGAGAGGPGPFTQRGALGAVPRTTARRHPRGIRGGGAPCGRTGESSSCREVGNAPQNHF